MLILSHLEAHAVSEKNNRFRFFWVFFAIFAPVYLKSVSAMASYHVDEIDQRILSYLVKNARMPFLEIARECGVSGAAIHQRVKRLEANGVITGSRLLVKPQALGLNVCAFVSISLSESTKYPEVIANLKKIPEIVECHFVTGRFAILAKLFCLDNDHLMEVLLNTIQKIPYIQSTDTMISLDEPIERQVWVKDFKSTSYSGRD